MSTGTRVTVVVPARNEARYIARCVEHIARQDYPANWIELLVVDGGSTDGTGSVATEAMRRWNIADGHVLDNPAGTTPSNLNTGLAKARGDILCRVDARTLIEPHYVRTCVETLTSRPDIAVVGGAQHAVAIDRHPISIGIARALNNRYSMGFSRYRRTSRSGEGDTVYLGAFRTEELRRFGGWNEQFPTNQDFELNRRMSAHGLVWFDASLRSGYIPRPTLRLLLQQYVRFGRGKVRYWRSADARPESRQIALVGAGAVGVVGAGVMLALPNKAKVHSAAGLLVAAAMVEHVGATGPEGRIVARACAIAAMGVTTSGWLAGVVMEMLAGRPDNSDHR